MSPEEQERLKSLITPVADLKFTDKEMAEARSIARRKMGDRSQHDAIERPPDRDHDLMYQEALQLTELRHTVAVMLIAAGGEITIPQKVISDYKPKSVPDIETFYDTGNRRQVIRIKEKP